MGFQLKNSPQKNFSFKLEIIDNAGFLTSLQLSKINRIRRGWGNSFFLSIVELLIQINIMIFFFLFDIHFGKLIKIKDFYFFL